MRRNAWRFLAALALCACGSSTQLTVDLKTDLASGTDFTSVRTTIGSQVVTYDATAHPASFVSGVRVAEAGVLPGTLDVDVALLAAGHVVAERVVRTTITASYALTVVVTRDCRGVSCPRAGDPVGATSCAGGRCVDPRCGGAAVDACPAPLCTSAADCAAPVACAVGLCVMGDCLAEPHDDRCRSSERCDLDRGCVVAPAPDGGTPDGGTPDGGAVDAGHDAGTPPPVDGGPICDPTACGAFGAICCAGLATCIDWTMDTSHCGDCTTRCAAGDHCVYDARAVRAGCATCDPTACAGFGAICCPGVSGCVNWTTDTNHCGRCDARCAASDHCVYDARTTTAACTACDPAACGAFGAICCPGISGCVNWTTDRNNCGGCGIVCPGSQSCVFAGTTAHCA